VNVFVPCDAPSYQFNAGRDVNTTPLKLYIVIPALLSIPCALTYAIDCVAGFCSVHIAYVAVGASDLITILVAFVPSIITLVVVVYVIPDFNIIPDPAAEHVSVPHVHP
jgi:hypothetical protein